MIILILVKKELSTMGYGELVREYIQDSSLSLGAIAKRMEKLGVKTDRSYLSKLRNNPMYPASEEVNRALAKATGKDEEALVFAAYMEKAPAVAKRYFSKLDALDAYLRKFAEANPGFNLKEILETITDDEKVEIFKIIFEDAIKQGVDVNTFIIREPNFTYLTSPKSNNDVRTVPIAGKITSYLEEIEKNHKEYEEFTCVDPQILKSKEGIAIRVDDDSMIGDRIYNNDIVIIALGLEVSSSDIALVRVKKETMLRKVKKQGDFCILSASNPAIDPVLAATKDVKIRGKVVEVRFQLSQEEER